jgi:hypothetical protein
MAGSDVRLPGFAASLKSPQSYITGMLRAFGEASKALGFAVDTLVVRLAAPKGDSDPDYQIGTMDGEDAAAFSGTTHDFLHDDITIRFEEDELQDQQYTAEQVKDWLNLTTGEGAGGPINPILSDRWREGDTSDPRD